MTYFLHINVDLTWILKYTNTVKQGKTYSWVLASVILEIKLHSEENLWHLNQRSMNELCIGRKNFFSIFHYQLSTKLTKNVYSAFSFVTQGEERCGMWNKKRRIYLMRRSENSDL
jgi:hypothetical protein